jgi:ABC-type nickel/cobalt efflux system permease component RcnA
MHVHEIPLMGNRSIIWRNAMETVTVAASRGFTVADMEMLIGSAVIVAVLAWMIFSKMKQLRGRQQEEPRV